jgi:2-keto-4-pentenoate hydratase/2-oxohepta-3-ene-1,7-dioic acid hydratase in catechol pathway
MRFVSWKKGSAHGLAARRGADLVNLEGLDLLTILRAGKEGLAQAAAAAEKAPLLDTSGLEYLPPLANPGKIVCVGMNYQDHADENKLAKQAHPTFFIRLASSLIAHGAPLIRPIVSEQLDFEGELAAIIGKPGRHIPVDQALDHIAGYAPFNEASIRDYQIARGQQWTLGKNFDGTGAFGPEFVTADELPPGAKGLHLETRLNGTVVQSANTDDLIFDIATLVSRLSEAVRLETGDVIVTGTPAGIGLFRKPQLWMKPGDVCEVEIERVGLLRNPVADEVKSN